MELTRRTFLSSSLAAGLIAATEATHTRWLLSKDTPIRIGVLNLGESGVEQAGLFSAIPGTEVAGLFGIQERTIHASLAQIQAHGRARPALYKSVDHLLCDPTLDMISISGRQSTIASPLSHVVAAKLPVLSDLPLEIPAAEEASAIGTLSRAKAPMLFRMNDFDDVSTIEDVQNWLARSSARETKATLSVPVLATRAQITRAGALSLTTIFEASKVPPKTLNQWLQTRARGVSGSKETRCGKVPVPENTYGISGLQILPCGGHPEISTLSLDHVRGSLRVPISNKTNIQATLRTTLRFLSQVRFRKETDNAEAMRALVASILMRSFQESLQ